MNYNLLWDFFFAKRSQFCSRVTTSIFPPVVGNCWMSFLISCWGTVNSETSATHWLPSVVHPKGSNALQEFLSSVSVVFREENSIYWLESKVCEEKKNSDSKRKHKCRNMGTEEIEMPFREELWERENSIKLILVLYCHCSCLFPHFPQNTFPSKIYSLMQEYVTDILAGSFLFAVNFLE